MNQSSGNPARGDAVEYHVARLLALLHPFIQSVNLLKSQHDDTHRDLTCAMDGGHHIAVQVKSGARPSLPIAHVRSWLLQSDPVLLAVQLNHAEPALVDYLPKYAAELDSSPQTKSLSLSTCSSIPLTTGNDAERHALAEFIRNAVSLWRILQASPGGALRSRKTTWGHILTSSQTARAAALYDDIVALVEETVSLDSLDQRSALVADLIGNLTSQRTNMPASLAAVVGGRKLWAGSTSLMRGGNTDQPLRNLVSAIDLTAQILSETNTIHFQATARVPLHVLRSVETILAAQNQGAAAVRLLGLLDGTGSCMLHICLLHALRYAVGAGRIGDPILRRHLRQIHRRSVESTKFSASPAELATLDSQFVRTRAMLGDQEAVSIQRQIASHESGWLGTAGLNQALFYRPNTDEKIDLQSRVRRARIEGNPDTGFYGVLLNRFAINASSVPNPNQAAQLWRTFRAITLA